MKVPPQFFYRIKKMLNKDVNIKLFFITVIAILCSVVMVTLSYSQEVRLTNGGNNYFQEVVVTHNDTDKCFFRESIGFKKWSNWIQKPPRDSNAQIFKPKHLNRQLVEDIIGEDLARWLDERTRTSGYYNFTTNSKYDWKKFGGEHYGTYNVESFKIKIYPPEE